MRCSACFGQEPIFGFEVKLEALALASHSNCLCVDGLSPADAFVAELNFGLVDAPALPTYV